MDQCLLGGNRYGCCSRFDAGRNDCRYNRGRDGSRSYEQQDHRGANHSGARTRCRRDGRVWWTAGECPDHGCEHLLTRSVYSSRRSNTGADSFITELINLQTSVRNFFSRKGAKGKAQRSQRNPKNAVALCLFAILRETSFIQEGANGGSTRNGRMSWTGGDD